MKLSPVDVHVWLLEERQIPEGMPKLYEPWLSDEESDRYSRFKFEKHRQSFLVSRALLRYVLSLYQPEIEPQAWCFDRNAYGKPYIVNDLRQPLYFNLTHTNGMMALLVSRRDMGGLDVEHNQRRGDLLAIADQYFSSDEVSGLASLPSQQQRQRFIDLWTLKEAYVKACGQGLSIPLADFGFTVDDNRIEVDFAPHRQESAHDWQFWQGEHLDAYTLAIAVKSGSQPISALQCYQVIPASSYKAIASIFRRQVQPLTVP